MHDINAILNKRESEEDIISKLRKKVRKLSEIHADMEETQSFILQLSSAKVKQNPEIELKEEETEVKGSVIDEHQIGSSGSFGEGKLSDK